MASRTCSRCKVVKSESDFYAHPAGRDGLMAVCKECTKQRVREHRAKNLDKVRAYDSVRFQRPERRAKVFARSNAWRKRFPDRAKAHTAVSNAIRDRKLKKKPCERCGATRVHAHHDDYSKPLDVMWLCPPCHSMRHKELST